MPVYDLKCEACGHIETDAFAKSPGSIAARACESCGEVSLTAFWGSPASQRERRAEMEPIIFAGVEHKDRASLDDMLRHHFGTADVSLEGVNRHNRIRDVEERAHRAVEKLQEQERRRGFDHGEKIREEKARWERTIADISSGYHRAR